MSNSIAKSHVQQLINNLQVAIKNGQFTNFIKYIRFPRYKNLENDAKITFDFPIVVLTGQNGSGKSSALHAIQGAPANSSPTKFWFSTKVDPIEDGESRRPTIIYGYNDTQNQSIEVIKTRIADKKYGKELDLWETSRPILSFGMQRLPKGKRNPPIKKEVRYFDFRAELSAYDKFFYFGDFKKSKNLLTKQDYIRNYSNHLRAIIDRGLEINLYNKVKNKLPKTLAAERLKVVNDILSKKYSECKIIHHSLFKEEGVSVYFKTDNVNYSDAFAGRGEYAVVKLVEEIYDAPNGSLIVLDEPEVSLHPGAQKRLILFLLMQTIAKKLQVVISTHSPHIVADFPEEAIKLFYSTPSGKFTIKNSTHVNEAFEQIGADGGNKLKIYVEDKLAHLLLSEVIKTLDGKYVQLFDVVYFPGGVDELYKNVNIYILDRETNKFFLLDGDQNKVKRDPGLLTANEMKSFSALEKILQAITGKPFKSLGFKIDSLAESGDESQKIAASISYIEYIWKYLYYLPGNGNPEELIWDEENAQRLLKTQGVRNITFGTNCKENFKNFSNAFIGESNAISIEAVHKIFIKNFCIKMGEPYNAIVALLDDFILKSKN